MRAVAKLMIEFIKSNGYDKPDISNAWFTDNKEANQLIIDNPFAFLVAVICDQGMPAKRVWAIPFELKARLGHLNPQRIADMPTDSLVKIFCQKPALHRFPKTSAKRVQAASRVVLERYEGKADRVWADKPSSYELYRRFESFEGIGQKKASMAVNILLREFGIEIRDKQGIDVSYDIHVRRVFLRTGLANKDDKRTIINAARDINPNYPGVLDLPSWLIGQKWCRPVQPDCHNCPLDKACPKLLQKSSV